MFIISIQMHLISMIVAPYDLVAGRCVQSLLYGTHFYRIS